MSSGAGAQEGGRRVRLPAVAGSFYPATRRELEAAVRGYLEAATPPGPGDPAPKALIAPHAGFVYSGPVAASAYAQLVPLRGRVERVVLIGPAHRVRVAGLAAPRAEAFATPLGQVVIDHKVLHRLLDLPQVCQMDSAHESEHSLEVHLPFLQVLLSDFRLVPLLAGDVSPELTADVLDALWGGDETLVIVSSDLSHYLDYASAQRMDAATTRAIETLDFESVDWDDACGRVPIRGLLLCARRRGLRVRTLDVRNSGDTAGTRDRVVGYGAWAFA